jgi:hypothetical protein
LTVTNTREVANGLVNGNFTLGFIEGPYDEARLRAQYIGSDEIVLQLRQDIGKATGNCSRAILQHRW